MDLAVGSTVGAVLKMQQSNLRNQFGTSILRKAMDQQASEVQQLLNVMPELGPLNPPELGNHLDTYA